MHMCDVPAAATFEQRLANAIAALGLGELLQLDAMLTLFAGSLHHYLCNCIIDTALKQLSST